MQLQNLDKLLEKWSYAFKNKALVTLMRHAPKSGSNESGLSEEGKRLATEYGKIFRSLFEPKFDVFLDKFGEFIFFRSEKERTAQTLELVFPWSKPDEYYQCSLLQSNYVSPRVQDQVYELHRKTGHWRGYYLNQTYYFLQELGGSFEEENNIHTKITERMVEGILNLFAIKQPVIYCGHSPAIEAACIRLLGISLSEFGGFLNPLDSIHISQENGKFNLITRINPIVGYVDLESETYYCQ
jgi:hypothetical protein